MSKTGYLILGVVIIGGAAYVFRDKLFGSPGATGTATPSTTESEALDFGIRGAVAGAVSAASDILGLDDAHPAVTMNVDAGIRTAPGARPLTLATLIGASARTSTRA